MLSGCMENAFAGSKMTTFWVVSEGQPFWGGWWPHFLPLSLRQPYNQPVSSPCWRRPGSSPPWPSHRWSTASLEPGKGGLRSPSLQPTQAHLYSPLRPKASIQSTYRGSYSPMPCSGGNQFAWSLSPETAAIETLGFQGAPASPLCDTTCYEGTYSGGRVGQALRAMGVHT